MLSIARPNRLAPARRLALLLAVPLLALLPASGLPTALAATPRLDLAAMALVPADLPDPGYVLLGGRLITPPEQARRLAEAAATTPATDAVPAATPTGEIRWLRGFESSLGFLPPGAASYSPIVVSRIDEYAGANSARAGFAATLQQAEATGATQLDVDVDVGSDAVAIIPAAPAGGLAVGIQVIFRNSGLIATLSLSQTENNPDLAATAIDLAQRLADRIEAVRDGPLGRPGLSGKALRVDDAGPDPFPLYIERYLLLDGVDVPRYDETPDVVAARTADYQASGIEAAYELQQYIPAGSSSWQDDTQYLVMVFRFVSEEAAATWVRRMPAVFAFYHGPAYADVRVLPDPPPLGDGASGYSYVSTNARDAQGYGYYVQFGREVALLQIAGVPTIDRATVEALAGVQLLCLQDGACPNSTTGA